jgi:DNA primase large subunit
MLSASSRIEAKKRAILDPKQQQFVKPQWEKQDYQHRMNFYTIPPTEDIALEDFEEWGIARLKVLAELEACHFRNRSAAETEEYMKPVLEKWLRLESNQSRSQDVQMQRKKDHYSHWTLRLAFASTADLRQRFTRLETQLFKLRLQADNSKERKAFIKSLPMSWEMLDAGEKNTWLGELRAATNPGKDDEEDWFKVDWEKVPELVERRQVLLKKGKAYVLVREQTTMVLSEFTRSLETGLELAARFLPRMDEDNRLAPILHHLSQSFVAPDASYNENSGVNDIANINAGSIDGLSSHFPLCMQNLHRELRKNSHLKHQSRLQYTLFLKGIGLNMQECIVFWRKAFKLITDGKFKEMPLYHDETMLTTPFYRKVQIRIPIQRPPQLRRRRRRRQQTRPRILAFQLPETPHRTAPLRRSEPRLPIPNILSRQPDHPLDERGRLRPRAPAQCEGRRGQTAVPHCLQPSL